MAKNDAQRTLERAAGGPLTFGRLIRAIREGEDLSLATLAGRLNVSRTHLSDIELGRRAVSVERAAAWARKLGYHAEQFVALALQAEVERAGLALDVHVTKSGRPATPHTRKRARSARPVAA